MVDHCPSEFVRFANRLSDAARDIAGRYYRQSFDVETKSDASPVTTADRAIEAAQRQLIAETFPEHGIRGEEYTDTGTDAAYVWVLDPIDGTKAFVSGIPVFTNLIALTHRGEAILGVIDQPILRERWLGASGHGTTFNGSPVHTGRATSLDKVGLHATTPEMFAGSDRAGRFERLASRTSYRRYGTDCYAYGLLASGHAHLVAEASMKVHDYMPVVAVVEGAGGVVTDWEGQPLRFDSDGTVLAAANATLHGAARDALAG